MPANRSDRATFDEMFDGDRASFPRRERLEKSEAEEIVGEVLAALQNADKYVALGEAVVNAAKPALTKALAILVGTISDIRHDLEPQLDKMSALGASALYRDYQHYVEAGFTKDQAFRLVLAALKPFSFSEMLSAAASNAAKPSKKNE
jgi:hypothetical protein